jgi:hypothetical protein
MRPYPRYKSGEADDDEAFRADIEAKLESLPERT